LCLKDSKKYLSSHPTMALSFSGEVVRECRYVLFEGKLELQKYIPLDLPLRRDGTLDQILGILFKFDPGGTAIVETAEPLPTPLLGPPYFQRKVPDYLETIKSRPEIKLKPTKCKNTLIPWKYSLPGSEEWVELDALGVKGIGYTEKLREYLLSNNNVPSKESSKN
jgi:hypothetical protein